MTENDGSAVAVPPRSGGDGERFASLAALQVAHLDFMKTYQHSREGTGTRLPAEEIRAFLVRARGAGASIGEDAERMAAQRILDYWSAALVACPDARSEDFSVPVLDPFAPAQEPEAESASNDPWLGASTLREWQSESRQHVRLAALARQWRDHGKSSGYLLSGAALADALHHRDTDPDIAELVDASQEAERLAERRRQRSWRLSVAGLAALIVLFAGLADYANLQRSEAEEQTRRAVKAHEETLREKLEADEAARIALEDHQVERYRLEQEIAALNRANLERIGELAERQQSLDAAYAFIRDMVDLGRITPADLPEGIAGALRPASDLNIFADEFAAAMTGYDAAFTGFDLPLPALPDSSRAAAFEGGAPIDYVNYSAVLNAERRTAFYVAVNLDREQRLVLPGGWPADEPDPRLPAEVQLPDPPEGSGSGRFVTSHLAGRSEISWGPFLRGDNEFEAAQKLAALVDVRTNAVPRRRRSNEPAWLEVERWVVAEHNPLARHVTIFSGPVFAADDRQIDGVGIPRQYWKIAASANALPSKGEPEFELVVDAFLVPMQADRGSDGGRTSIDPESYRVPVAKIEDLTGLEFAAILRRTADDGPTQGDQLAARVRELDTGSRQERVSLAQELVNFLRDRELDEWDQRKVVGALVEMARDESMQALTATGRLNLLFVLSEIPAESWRRQGWTDLMAQARRAAADLATRAARGQTEIGPQTRPHLDQLRGRIGLTEPPDQRVVLSFSGIPAEEAAATADLLRQLGWAVGDGERSPEAAGRNGVRYRQGEREDGRAARLLAADLRAAGQAQVGVPQFDPGMERGTVTILLSRPATRGGPSGRGVVPESRRFFIFPSRNGTE